MQYSHLITVKRSNLQLNKKIVIWAGNRPAYTPRQAKCFADGNLLFGWKNTEKYWIETVREKR